jgi:hypothetical protein
LLQTIYCDQTAIETNKNHNNHRSLAIFVGQLFIVGHFGFGFCSVTHLAHFVCDTNKFTICRRLCSPPHQKFFIYDALAIHGQPEQVVSRYISEVGKL